MENTFAIATFCFGERYQNQANRLITEINNCVFKPIVVIVTDKPSNIKNFPFVKVFDISEFNPEYKNYANSYYEFDFSVKRYSLLAALSLGFTKIILTDADAVPNKSLFNEETILKGFVGNSIQGQVTYNFSNEISTNSQLGRRFLEYEKHFDRSFDKNDLNFMPEDCVQFIDIDMPKFYNFLRIWDKCIEIKKKESLSNVPAGNIDEMCFSALYCGLTVGNNSNRVINVLTNIHDKWYTGEPSSVKNYMTKKIVVSSIYELFYCKHRGSGLYKGIDLLTITIRNSIFDGYDYVIYTDKNTYDKYRLYELIPQTNVTFKLVELNGEYFTSILKPIQIRRIDEGEIWDRIHSVNNYIEVILNKIEFMIMEANQNPDSEIVWLDSGLFGTSCGNNWRNKMQDLCHTQTFVNKIFEKIEEFDFISLKGNGIMINYEIKEKINRLFNTDIKIVPGCLFGGKSKSIINNLSDYKLILSTLISNLKDYTSEQELLSLLLNDKNVKFFEFNDWDDLQRGMLKILDNYDDSKYELGVSYMSTESDESFANKGIIITKEQYKSDFIEVESYPLSDDQILERIISVSNSYLDTMDLSHNNYMLDKMSDFALYYHYPSGKEHYRLLTFISKLYDNEILYDIGTNNGCSAISLSHKNNNIVKTYDIVDYTHKGVITKPNIIFHLENISKNIEVVKESRFIMLDANHDGIFENIFYNQLKEINYTGILFLDDIHLNSTMKEFWNSIDEEKYDLTIKGHNTGSGLVILKKKV